MTRFVVCKFGGTSVSSRATWDNIAGIAQRHIKDGLKPVIVCSALSQASNKLEKAIESALLGQQHTILTDILDSYQELATSLNVTNSVYEQEAKDLQQWLEGISLLKEASAKTRARIMSLGELMLTRIGQAFLNQYLGGATLLDARTILQAETSTQDAQLRYLAARCPASPNTVSDKNADE